MQDTPGQAEDFARSWFNSRASETEYGQKIIELIRKQLSVQENIDENKLYTALINLAISPQNYNAS